MKLKKTKIAELKNQAASIREQILDATSKYGGHLSANLGVVELTIMLHEVFNFPDDLLLFDVSHQCYTHKILSGRTLDQLGTLGKTSGFMKPKESVYDAYSLGHSSTTLSIAIGEAIKNHELKKDTNIIVVIGDAAINNGLAFEALNYLNDHKELKVIIIVNDNNMSISKQSGGITKSLNNLRSKRQKSFIYKITPHFIHPLLDLNKRAFKGLFYQKNFFDSFSFKYFLGIDGHDFNELFKYLNFAKNYQSTTILHINSIKGKGYRFAEEDKIGLWHNVPPFDLATGKIIDEENVVGIALADELIKLNEKHNNIKVLLAAMLLGNGLSSFKEQFPDALIDVGIAEENAVTIASSLAPEFVPFVFIYSTFIARATDEIINEVLRVNKKVIFCMDRSGLVSKDGSHHQGIFDVQLFSGFPNAKIYAPSSLDEAKYLLNKAYLNNGATFIRYPKVLPNCVSPLNDGWDVLLPIDDVNIITYGALTYELKEDLKNHHVGLINAKIIKPLDEEVIKQLFHKKVIVYEEVNAFGALFDLLNHEIMINHWPIELSQIAITDTYLEEGSIKELRDKYQLGLKQILKEIE